MMAYRGSSSRMMRQACDHSPLRPPPDSFSAAPRFADADVLAGESCSDNVNCSDFIEELVRSDALAVSEIPIASVTPYFIVVLPDFTIHDPPAQLVHVVEDRHVWPVLAQHALRCLVDFAERNRLKPCPFQTEAEAANP
jgi:hypothetical protein